jgi:hypothetical protein
MSNLFPTCQVLEEFLKYRVEPGRPSHGIMFFCKAGKHRSFAAAVCFLMFMCPWADHQHIMEHCLGTHARFDLGSTINDSVYVRGRRRLSLFAFVNEFSKTVKSMLKNSVYVRQDTPMLQAVRYEPPRG